MIRIALDMDGVVTDFMGDLFYHFGIEMVNPYNSSCGLELEVGCWDTIPAICEHLKITERELWNELNEDFWGNMSWTKRGSDLLELCEDAVGKDNMFLLSSPANPISASGKIKWVNHHLPDYNSRLHLAKNKGFASSPFTILLDDGHHNIESFKKYAGLTVLVPSYYNADHELMSSLYTTVQHRLSKMKMVSETRQKEFSKCLLQNNGNVIQ